MTLHFTPTMKRLVALLASISMVTIMGACSSDGKTQQSSQSSQQSSVTTDNGNVVIFTPSDGLTISQQTPLNKWEKLVPEIVSSLKQSGITSGNISVKTASTLDKQSQSVQDYVVDHINDTDHKASHGKTTLVIAPVADVSESDKQYGDYAEHHITWDSDATDDTSQNDARSAQRLVSALQLAQNEGMKTILVSNTLQGYTPNVYVPIISAGQVGRLQAQELVSKLELDKTSSTTPKRIEMLLPYDSGNIDTSFAQNVFKGAWKVLEPYFKDGRAISPSGTLTTSTTEDDWESVAFEASKDEHVKSTLAKRLDMDKSDSHPTRIDGIISCNDYVAGNVIDELDKLGYTGSAADVNPSISISGIVDSITGKKDLKRESVPDPVAQSPSTNDADDDTSDDEKNTAWPIVTGYGAYVSSMPSIVNGKQWMTVMENRKQLANDIAQACVHLNTSSKLSKLGFITSTAVEGKQTPTIREQPLAISASNLKKTLIEPGYISLADAGL